MVSVADCERVQTEWFRARAEADGGSVWSDGGMLWVDGPDGLNVMFPDRVDRAALGRGVSRAIDSGRSLVGAWLGLDVGTAALTELGFDRGWAPWWMEADLTEVPYVVDKRVRLDVAMQGDRSPPDLSALNRQQPTRAWHAVAQTRRWGAPVGEAWSFLDDDIAGVFNMSVRRQYRRRGIGRGLLSAVCEAAAEAGAHHAVLNATPEGERLYSRCGFRRIGEGITWWRDLRVGLDRRSTDRTP